MEKINDGIDSDKVAKENFRKKLIVEVALRRHRGITQHVFSKLTNEELENSSKSVDNIELIKTPDGEVAGFRIVDHKRNPEE
ncbi:MAG TPA: hypothetical protein VI819_00995 [Patescibacteria group bacterium]|nr:hypothetical protein [Patescibacteria group bacterium]